MDAINAELKQVTSFEDFEKIKHKIQIFEDIARKIMIKHNLPSEALKLFSEGTNIVFLSDNEIVIKIFPPCHQDQFDSERLVLKALESNLTVQTPDFLYDGEISNWRYIVMTYVKGTLLETLWQTLSYDNKLIIMRELGSLIKEVHSISTKGLESIDCHWEVFIKNQIENSVKTHEKNNLPPLLLKEIPTYIESIAPSISTIQKPVILTGEYTPMNLLVTSHEGVWHISGLIDFGDAMLGYHKYDLLGPGAFLVEGNKGLLNAFMSSYGLSPEELNEPLSHELTALMLLHKYSNLDVQARIPDWESKVFSLKDLENLVWGFN